MLLFLVFFFLNKSWLKRKFLICVAVRVHVYIYISLPLKTLRLNFRTAPYFIIIIRLLLTENNGKKNATAVGLCAVFVVSWW